jgi:hypothetical protein
MTTEAAVVRVVNGLLKAGAAAAVVLCCEPAGAQTTTMPSTLRYGSGLIDVPVSSVLPHLAVTGTLSGFFLSLDQSVAIDDAGAPLSLGAGVDEFFPDGSLSLGLWDRVEVGTSLQAFGDAGSGGDVWGVFGRVRLWEPIDQGLGLAVGGRFLTSPSFADERDYAPGRLGFSDERLRKSYTVVDGVDTNVSLYAVATAYLRGFDGGLLPRNDITLSLGYGGGMFKSGSQLDFYAPGDANGWFFGSAFHFEVSDASLLTLMAEHNGFDVNVGAHFDWSGLRFGAQYLATNHVKPAVGYTSAYQKPKLGLLASVRLCPGRANLFCRPHLLERTEPDTVWIPPPPPDTVVVSVGAEQNVTGADASLCLSTGQDIPIRLTADGDTLVAPEWVSVRRMRPHLEFVGTYARGAFWYESSQDIRFEQVLYEKSPDIFPLGCDQILRVGVHEGVSLFAPVSAERPLDVLFVPVRPGLWHRYPRVGSRPDRR